MRRRHVWMAGLLSAGLLLAGGEAGAVPFGFYCLTLNSAGSCATGEAQLSVDVSDAGGNTVLFTFANNGPTASSITDIYFDDGGLLGISSIINNPGYVQFSQPAVPGNLPGSGLASPSFLATDGFTADSDPPPSAMGVNPGEDVGIVFDLIAGQTFADVLWQLDTDVLRIGIHVQSFPGGYSESFINVPEPGPAVLLGLGLAGLAIRARRAR